MSNTYQNQQLEDIEQLKNIFPDGEADERNWCVLSTSGVHGLYTTLDDLEQEYKNGNEDLNVTVLVIMPRLVSMLYGHINITIDDIPYLRKLVSSSLKYMCKSQENNITK
ncbi:hypothetical protein R6231_14390 [Bacillus cytotoxicus]|uniref:hypothetical protein n=1 Tax=Bacillus cereus group TaxID=86661 RepID=UPI000B97B2F3|nr:MULTISPECIES: hypothetical protein [Bacillus cereus group]AWC31028.1 hypothetical protein CG483_022685 [Bacillus cytotoxicus]AWC35024.1 hypothetical protein CG482_022460 [Bacillus cytotoxicus]AWC39062.1 hypothetical protein CG481_022460 [Bacillus cytotoxicus]AWC43120.1 hypothetical protein CG480_022520 [Bacillus cytotoxicus]AWC51051.1 hypothetical protein CG478_022520 [Bacillus cytotoxicus]